jgi:monofunctional glycosyltransferase
VKNNKVGSMLRVSMAILIMVLFAFGIYAGLGYYDALQDAAMLKRRASDLIASHHGPDDLTQCRLVQLIRVEDPNFWHHNGVDVETKGAGLTTITQSLSKRLAFEHFKPGIGKIRQTTYAWGLESRLSKKEILTLFLDTAELGQGPTGWMKGVFDTSQQVYEGTSGLDGSPMA